MHLRIELTQLVFDRASKILVQFICLTLFNQIKSYLCPQNYNPISTMLLRKIISFIILVICCLPIFLSAQPTDSTKTIEVLHANKWNMIRDSKIGNKQRLLGAVRAKHEQTLFFCDSAYIYGQNNDIEAFGHVIIEVNDSVKIYADYLKYNATSRQALLKDNIVLHNRNKRLYTNDMIYERNTGIANYWVWGKLVDSTNVLTSIKGYYYSREKVAKFKNNVEVQTPEYTIKSDTIEYNTQSKIVRFSSPTTLQGDSVYAYAENGSYNQLSQDVILKQKAVIYRKTNMIKGDSLYMNDSLGLAKAKGHTTLADTAQNIEIHGQQAYYNKFEKQAWVTNKAFGQYNSKQDTMYMHADTLKLVLDSVEQPKQLLAFHGMRFFSRQMQGMADSLCYYLQDSSLYLHQQVFLWHKEQQIACKWAEMHMQNNMVDSAIFHNDVLLASQDTIDPKYFNQMQGKTMYAWFSDNEIRKLRLVDKVKTNYFTWEEDGSPVGMFYIESQSLNIWLNNQKIKIATYYTQINNTTFPLDKLPPEKAKLSGFEWKTEWRPKNKEDIFRKTTPN